MADYNFDGIKDIYLPLKKEQLDNYQVNSGLLCTLDSNYVLTEHPDTKELGNIKLIDSTQTIYSEKLNLYENGAKLVCRLNHKWINEELMTTALICP